MALSGGFSAVPRWSLRAVLPCSGRGRGCFVVLMLLSFCRKVFLAVLSKQLKSHSGWAVASWRHPPHQTHRLRQPEETEHLCVKGGDPEMVWPCVHPISWDACTGVGAWNWLGRYGSLSVGLKGRVHDLFSGALSASVLAATLLQYL